MSGINGSNGSGSGGYNSSGINGGGGGPAPTMASHISAAAALDLSTLTAEKKNEAFENAEKIVKQYIKQLKNVSSTEELGELKKSLSSIYDIIDHINTELSKESTEQSTISKMIGTFSKLLNFQNKPYPWQDKVTEINNLLVSKNQGLASPGGSGIKQIDQIILRIKRIKEEIEHGIINIRMARNIAPEAKEGEIVNYCYGQRDKTEELKGLLVNLSTFPNSKGLYEETLKEISLFGIKELGINFVTSKESAQNKKLSEDFQEFCFFVFKTKEFVRVPGEDDLQQTFRQTADTKTIEAALNKFEKGGYDSLNKYVRKIQNEQGEDPQAFRNNVSVLIKKLLEDLLIGKVKIDVATLPLFSTLLFSLFLSVDLKVFTYNTFSRGFALTKVIFKEVEDEIGKFLIDLEGYKHDKIFLNFLKKNNLEIETDKFKIAFVKWMLFPEDEEINYTDEEKKFAARVINSHHFPKMEIIANQAKKLGS